jgi:hypothetical protein
LERNFTIQVLFQNKTQAPAFLFPKRHSPEIAGVVIGVSLIRRPDARKDLSTPRDLLQPTSGVADVNVTRSILIARRSATK